MHSIIQTIVLKHICNKKFFLFIKILEILITILYFVRSISFIKNYGTVWKNYISHVDSDKFNIKLFIVLPNHLKRVHIFFL